jgi:hypothetical protein
LSVGARATYRTLVGGLLYLATRTRIDIAYAVTSLAHHTKDPTVGDMKDAMRVLQYLNGTREDGLRVVKQDGLAISVYADAAWISDDQANTWMGHIVMANGTPIIWRSILSDAKYPSVSSGEYVSMCNGWGRAEQIKRILQSIGVEIPCIPIYSTRRLPLPTS